MQKLEMSATLNLSRLPRHHLDRSWITLWSRHAEAFRLIFHISRVHPHLPCILHLRHYDMWLDREETERLPLSSAPTVRIG
jgi:hypothetical protein